jgi:hypothetical protein
MTCNHLWQAWTRTLQLTVTMLSIAFYEEEVGGPKGKGNLLWRRITNGTWNGVTTVASTIGDWIERNTRTVKSNHRIRTTINRRRMKTTTRAMMAMSVLAMQDHATVATERKAVFDTDSDVVGVDNRCTGCISHIKEDFVGPLTATNRVVKGFGGSRTMNVKVGTLKWSWEDDQGCVHSFDIPESFYVPEGNVRLLSPQHWAQSQVTSKAKRRRFGERTNGNECVLFWGEGQERRIELDKRDNVATFRLAPGNDQFKAFCCEAGLEEPFNDLIALPAGIISDDDDEDVHDEVDGTASMLPRSDRDEANAPMKLPWHSASKEQRDQKGEKPSTADVTFDLNGPTATNSKGEATPNVVTDEENRQPESDMGQLLLLHHRYGHISMRKLQEMAKQGMLPKRLSNCRIPTCSACLYANATKQPWRGKTRKNDINDDKPGKPGEVFR